jgi:hypothetical protein
MLAQLLTSTVYTRARAHKFDASIDPHCPACGLVDDLPHRLYACTASEEMLARVDSVIPTQPQPMDWRFPLDSDPKYFRIRIWRKSVTFDRVFDPLNFTGGNPIYTDGSCRHPNTANALSAGAAVTLAEGTPEHGTYHAVGLATSNLQHISFFGEVTGLVAALELTAGSASRGTLPSSIVTIWRLSAASAGSFVTRPSAPGAHGMACGLMCSRVTKPGPDSSCTSSRLIEP